MKSAHTSSDFKFPLWESISVRLTPRGTAESANLAPFSDVSDKTFGAREREIKVTGTVVGIRSAAR